MTLILETIFILITPLAIIALEKKVDAVRKIGAITICYALGFCIAVLNIPYDKGYCETLASVVVAIAIPTMLFGTDLLAIKNIGKKMLTSFALISCTVMIVSVIAAMIGNTKGIESAASLSGMSTGLYIGGTPNLFAVGKALLKDNFNLINSAYIADSILGGVYFLLLVSAVKKIYAKILGRNTDFHFEETDCEDQESTNKGNRLKTLIPLGLGALCFALGVLVEYLINGNLDGSMFIILSVSILGIVLSFIKPIRNIKESEKLSQYLILVFSLGLGMSLDISKIGTEIITSIIYFGSIMIASIFVHFMLCKLFKIDGGTAIVTSVAAIYGPPFVITVADSYGEKQLAAPGVICGAAGLIIGNFLGIGIGNLLMLII